LTKFAVIGGNASTDLAKKIAKRLNANFIKFELRVFPDGESKITFLSKPKERKIVIVQSTGPPVDSNLIQALSLVSKAKQFSSEIIMAVPYMGYARQDREFLPGEISTMKVIAKIFESVGVKKIIVVDIHSMFGLKHFKIPAKNVSAVPELVNYFKKMKLKNPLIVSPDGGGKKRVSEFAKLLKSDFLILKKQRDKKTGKIKIISPNEKNVKGRSIILVDDMISTGGSIIKATEFLKKQKCGRIYAACTHALLLRNAAKEIKKAGVVKIISANTIPGKTAVVDISNVIAKAII